MFAGFVQEISGKTDSIMKITAVVVHLVHVVLLTGFAMYCLRLAKDNLTLMGFLPSKMEKCKDSG